MGIRVLVCGGRAFDEQEYVNDCLGCLDAERPIAIIIHGAAAGADACADAWAKAHGRTVAAYPARWRQHGKKAGPIRNQLMLDEGKPDLVVAFPGGPGTADMVERAERRGIEVITFDNPADIDPEEWPAHPLTP